VENSIKGAIIMDDSRLPKTKFEFAHDIFEFDQWPFYNMSRLISLYHRRLDAALKPVGIDTSRWRVLSILGKRGTATVTQISEEAATLMSTTAKIIRRMVAQDLVSTSTSQKDARSIEVSLTDKGAATLSSIQERVDAVAARSFYKITENDIDLLNQTTRKMYENLKI
jgi:DNA-binding MarR family transcriptional regulator